MATVPKAKDYCLIEQMKKISYLLFLGVFFMGCTSNTIIKKPDNLISKKQMVDLLTDLAIASGAENIKNNDLERNVNYFPLVFKKYGIDSTRFKESNYYYTSRIDDYEEILKKVDDRLKAMKKELDDKIRLQDSLKNDSMKNLRENFKKVPRKPIKKDSLKSLSVKK